MKQNTTYSIVQESYPSGLTFRTVKPTLVLYSSPQAPLVAQGLPRTALEVRCIACSSYWLPLSSALKLLQHFSCQLVDPHRSCYRSGAEAVLVRQGLLFPIEFIQPTASSHSTSRSLPGQEMGPAGATTCTGLFPQCVFTVHSEANQIQEELSQLPSLHAL